MNWSKGRSQGDRKLVERNGEERQRDVPLSFNALLKGPPALKPLFRRLNTFVYAKAGLYEVALRHILGTKWRDGRYSVLVQTEGAIEALQKSDKRTLVVLPVVESDGQFNRLVTLALSVGNPVWVVGYPTILRRHLWMHFRGFIIFQAPQRELSALRGVITLSQRQISSLTPESGEGIVGMIAICSADRELGPWFFDEM